MQIDVIIQTRHTIQLEYNFYENEIDNIQFDSVEANTFLNKIEFYTTAQSRHITKEEFKNFKIKLEAFLEND